jgi:hypothetical protein
MRVCIAALVTRLGREDKSEIVVTIGLGRFNDLFGKPSPYT